MGIVRDVTIDQLTQAVQGISSTGISDSTGQAINNTLGTLGKDTSLQDIKTSINELANAVKPSASDIPYDSSLSVKGKIDEVNIDLESLVTLLSHSINAYASFNLKLSNSVTLRLQIGKLNANTNYLQFFVNGIDYGYITFDVSRNVGVIS